MPLVRKAEPRRAPLNNVGFPGDSGPLANSCQRIDRLAEPVTWALARHPVVVSHPPPGRIHETRTRRIAPHAPAFASRIPAGVLARTSCGSCQPVHAPRAVCRAVTTLLEEGTRQ